MGDIPDQIVLARHRDLKGASRAPWARRAILAAIVLFAVLGLANVFGQRPSTSSAATSAAELTLYAPERLRGGLLFSARFHVHARQELRNAVLVLEPGWLEGMAVNTIEPSPVGEASSDGRLTLQLGHIPKGSSYALYMQFQVNPTNLAWRRNADVLLEDGSRPILRIHHHYTIYP